MRITQKFHCKFQVRSYLLVVSETHVFAFQARIKKLIDIWERGNTFPIATVNGFKEKLNAPNGKIPCAKIKVIQKDRYVLLEYKKRRLTSNFVAARSTTPNGTPPRSASTFAAPAAPAPPVANTSAILANLQALANKTNGMSTGTTGNPLQGSSNNVSFPQTAFPQQNIPSVNPIASLQPAFQAVSAPTPANNGVFAYGNGSMPNFFQGGGQPQQAPNAAAGMMPQGNGAGVPDNLQQQLQILTAQGIPQ